jgi:hypothetical protein
MNEFGWARGNDCKILRFGLLSPATGARASHFFILNSRQDEEEASGSPLGGSLGCKSGHI